MSPVTTTACGRSRSERAHGGVEHLGRERLLRPERRVDRRAQPVEERRPRGRLLVAHVRVGELAERGQRASGPDVAARGPPAARRGRARGTRRRRGPRASPCSVDVAARPGGRAVAAAAGERDEARMTAARLIPRAAPATTGSRSTRRATSAVATAASASSPATTSRTWPGPGAIGSEAKPAASRATSGPSTATSSATPAIAPGSATAAAAPSSTSATVLAVAAAGPQQRDRAAPLARGRRQRLHQRVQAHEPDREPDAAQHRGEHAEELRVARRRAAHALRRRAERPQRRAPPPPGRRRRRAGSTSDGVALAAQRVRPRPGDPAVVLQRAHDADDAEARLVAARELDRERRARPQPERVGQPEADLDLVRAAQAPARGQRRRLEARVVARVGDRAGTACRAGTSRRRRPRSGCRRRPRRGSPRTAPADGVAAAR